MSWRDDVKLAVAKRMYARHDAEIVSIFCSESIPWDESKAQEPWLSAAENAIQDTRDGAQDAGWTVEFVKDLP